MSNENTKRTATQRIEDLENGLMTIYQTLDAVARDVLASKEAIKLLNNKVDAIVKATNSGAQLTDEVLTEIMVQNNIDDLKQKVTNLLNAGFLVAQEAVDLSSFIVGRDVKDDGSVINPRIQFALRAIEDESIRNKLLGAKAGDTLTLEEGKALFQVLETYLIQNPNQTTATEEPLEVSSDVFHDQAVETTTEQPTA